MSAFARGQLEKYGWKEGKGLGKHEHGIATALRPKLKFDTHGVGHDPGKEFTNDWWNLAFNQAAKNITVVNSDNGVVVNSMKHKHKKESTSSKGRYTSSFVKTATMLSNGEMQFEKAQDIEASKGNEDIDTSEPPRITEEELIAKCGGRTAHKAARHGFKLSGKLLRLQHQEALLLNPNTPPTSNAAHFPSSQKADSMPQKKRHHKQAKELIHATSSELPKPNKRFKLPEDRLKRKKKKR